MASDLLAQQKPLHQKYLQLRDIPRSLVQVFALLYQPVGRTKALNCWNTAIPPTVTWASTLNPHHFHPLVRELLNGGLLTQEPNEGPRCADLLVDIAVRDAVKEGTFEPIAQTIAEQFPIRTRYYEYGPRVFSKASEFMRELRIAFYRQDAHAIESLDEDFQGTFWNSTLKLPRLLQNILNNPFDHEWFASLSIDFQQYVLSTVLADSARRCIPADNAFELLEATYDTQQDSPELDLLYVEQLWLRGHLGEASAVLARISNSSQKGKFEALRGAIAFLNGHTEAALTHYRSGLKAAGKSQSAQSTWFQMPATLLYLFALLKDGSPAAYRAAENYATLLQKYAGHWLFSAMPLFLHLLKNQQGRFTPAVTERFTRYTVKKTGLAALLEIYSLYWLGLQDLDQWLPAQLPRLYRTASQADYG